MGLIVERLRLAYRTSLPIGGRTRFVMVSMLIAAPIGLILEVIYAAAYQTEVHTIFFLVVGCTAILSYVMSLAFELLYWVVNGFDESRQRNLFRFVVLLIVSAGLIAFVSMFRYETIDWNRGADTCWSMSRDRWTDRVSTRPIECPPKPEREGKVIPI